MRMHEGLVEATYYPRNPLDVLAQQIWSLWFRSDADRTSKKPILLVRRAAPFADLPRSSFEGVLDMLSGLYPSEQFSPS